MDRLPEQPDGFDAEIAFDDESLPLWVRIQEAERMMKLAQREAKGRGITLSAVTARYYSAKAEETLELYEKGYPATLIANMIKGQPRTNALLEKKLAEEAGYRNAVEATNVYKLIARILNDEQQREWEQARRTV